MRFAALALVLFVACGEGNAGGPDAAGARSGKSVGSVTTSQSDGGKLDGLTLTLEVKKATLSPGEETSAFLHVENASGEPVTDPGCRLSAVSYGLVPADAPDAPLDFHIVVDCSGAHTYEPGDTDRHSHRFFARTIRGDDLPPGDYLATLEIRGYSERVSAPVTVVD